MGEDYVKYGEKGSTNKKNYESLKCCGVKKTPHSAIVRSIGLPGKNMQKVTKGVCHLDQWYL